MADARLTRLVDSNDIFHDTLQVGRVERSLPADRHPSSTGFHFHMPHHSCAETNNMERSYCTATARRATSVDILSTAAFEMSAIDE